MIAIVVLVLLLLDEVRGVVGALFGAFIGAVGAVGLVDAVRSGKVAATHAPGDLLSDLLPLALLVLLLARAGSHGVLAAALAWFAGSAAAAALAVQSGLPGHAVALGVSALAALGIVATASCRLARPRRAASPRGWMAVTAAVAAPAPSRR